jgi:hypothetical protein
MSRLREKMQARKAARQERQSAGIQQQYGQMTDAYSKILSPKSSEELPKPKPTNVISDFMKFQNSPSVQKAREEMEWREGMDTRMEYDLSKRQLTKEEERVMEARKRLGKEAEKAASGGMGLEELGASKAQLKALHGYACNSYSCQMMQNAAMTTSKSGNPVNTGFVNKEGRWGDKLDPGEKMRIMPKNIRFDKYAKDLGWQIQPEGTIANQPGDLMRDGYWTTGPGGEPHWTHHSAVSIGELEGGGANVVYNPGNEYEGVKYGDEYYTKPEAYKKGEGIGVMRYVGDIPEYTKQFQALGGYENAPKTPRMPTKDAVKIKTEDVKPELQTLPKPTQEEMLSALAVGRKNPNRYKRKLKRQANKFTL